MKTAGIIAEYNPFHEGHKYHIEKTRELTDAEYVIAAMSGDYVQRGEPAIVSKYVRARRALEEGVDLVLELPAAYATGSAQFFAMGGVSLLHQTGCVDYLSFGSEYADVSQLSRVAALMDEESPVFQQKLRGFLRQGLHFPKARMKALEEVISPDDAGVLNEPNHILGIEYIRALKQLRSKIVPVSIKRAGNGYHDESLNGEYISATAIRKALKEKRSLTGRNYQEAEALFLAGETVSWNDLLPYLQYQMMFQGEQIAGFFGMNLEIYNRMKHNMNNMGDFDEYLSILHERNRTDAAIKRALLHVVLQMENCPELAAAADVRTPYARILGFRRSAVPLLRRMKETSKIPIIQKPIAGTRLSQEDAFASRLYSMDIQASDFYDAIIAGKTGRKPICEYNRQQIIID